MSTAFQECMNELRSRNEITEQIFDEEMQDMSNSEDDNENEPGNFDKLPLELLTEIFKYLNVAEKNKIRKVAFSWDRAIKLGFGVKIILNNHNIQDVAHSQDIFEIQVRNLTARLPTSPVFRYAEFVQNLEVMGMILSHSMLQLCSAFSDLTFLKLNRVYLETDRHIPISPEEKTRFPKSISNLTMRFLRTIHKHSGFGIGRNTDIYSLTPSDNIMLNVLSEFELPKLVRFQFYHAMTEDVEAERNSDMINRARNIDADSETESSRLLSGFIDRAWDGFYLKKIKVDNIPKLIITRPHPPSFQLTQLEVKGMMGAHWIALLDSQSYLKTLKLVLLNLELMQNVKNAIRRNSSSLEVISLIVATPNDMLLNVENPLENNNFDVMFFTDCLKLLHLKLQYAPKIIDVSFLPTSIKSLNVCGNVQGLTNLISIATDLKCLTLDICDGPIVRDTPPEKPLFTQASTVHRIIKESAINKIVMSEVGAKQEYKNIVGSCDRTDFIEAKLSTVEYKITFPEEDDIGRQGFVNVPRIKIDVSDQFSRNYDYDFFRC